MSFSYTISVGISFRMIVMNIESSCFTSRHPRRPRGSQLALEKRRDESFQARAEELFRPCLKTFVAPFLLWRRFARKFVQNHRSRAQKVQFQLTCVPQNRRCFSNHLSTIVVQKKMGNTVQRTIYRESSEAIGHHKYLGVELSSDLNC